MSGIDSDLIRGHIDTIILKSLYHGDKYGLEIIQEVEEKSNGTYELKQPTLYSCLKRLESQGLISSYWEDSDIGGRRHYYKLTEKGKETYKANQEEWLRSREIIDNLIYNTSIQYATIYDDDAVVEVHKPASENPEKNENEDTENTISNEDEEQNKKDSTDNDNEHEFLVGEDEEKNTDEFVNYDNIDSTAGDNFFSSNNEKADEDEQEVLQEPTFVNTSIPSEADDGIINLNLEENLLPPEEDTNNEEETSLDEISLNDVDVVTDDSQGNNEPDDDDIYTPESLIPEDEQIYTPEQDEEDTLEEKEDNTYTPTYINFSNNSNYEEADITNIESNEDAQDNNSDKLEDNNDNQNIEDTANDINEQYYASKNETVFPHASEEEINKIYQTTENYDKLQAGYTDETYKQALNELESYGGGSKQADIQEKTNTSSISYDELKEKLESDGIIVRKYERQVKENNDNKLYIKTTQIHLVKNWAVWSITTFATLLTFIIMNAFKNNYTYDFAFWPFITSMAVSLIIPAYTTIKYIINPYKKVVAKYAPRLSILINLLITIQLVVITYCVNLQAGFYSFSQENYNHLLWILPLILCFIPILQSLTYMVLFNSKKFHA